MPAPTDTDYANVFADVEAEINRQAEMWGEDRRHLSPDQWNRILTEETGEFARAIEDEGPDEMHAELVQVAAVAINAAVHLNCGSADSPWEQLQRSLAQVLRRHGPALPAGSVTCSVALVQKGEVLYRLDVPPPGGIVSREAAAKIDGR